VSPNQAGSRARCPAHGTKSSSLGIQKSVILGWQAKARAASPASQVWSLAFVFILTLISSIWFCARRLIVDPKCLIPFTDVLLWYHMLSFDYVWFRYNSLCDMNEVFVCWCSLSTFLLCLSLCQSTKLSNLAAGNQPNEYLSIVPPGGSFNYF